MADGYLESHYAEYEKKKAEWLKKKSKWSYKRPDGVPANGETPDGKGTNDQRLTTND